MEEQRRVTWFLYDGTCGLCHGGVKFAIANDPNGAVHFAPLFGETHDRLQPPATRTGADTTTDSMILITPNGRAHVRSDAIVELLRTLRAPLPLVGALLHALPRRLRDTAYDALAKHRKGWFAPPPDACPVVPAEVRARIAR
jgi:predicted DCC family thiol-disulfide oxidoreductase YuxK